MNVGETPKIGCRHCTKVLPVWSLTYTCLLKQRSHALHGACRYCGTDTFLWCIRRVTAWIDLGTLKNHHSIVPGACYDAAQDSPDFSMHYTAFLPSTPYHHRAADVYTRIYLHQIMQAFRLQRTIHCRLARLRVPRKLCLPHCIDLRHR